MLVTENTVIGQKTFSQYIAAFQELKERLYIALAKEAFLSCFFGKVHASSFK